MRYIILIALFSSSQIHAETFRCGNKIISEGMTTHELIYACGASWMPDEIRTNIKHYSTPSDIEHFVTSLPASANTYQWWVYRPYGEHEKWLWVVNGYIQDIQER